MLGTKKLIISILFCTSLFWLLVDQAQAESLPQFTEKALIISEINWDGSLQSQADEWIELYNPTDQVLDLSEYIFTGLTNESEIVLDDSLPPGQFYLLSNYGQGKKSSLQVEPDYVSSAISLSNQTLDIRILRNDTGELVDCLSLEEVNNNCQSISPKDYSLDLTSLDLTEETEVIFSLERAEDLSWQPAAKSLNLDETLHYGTPQAPNSIWLERSSEDPVDSGSEQEQLPSETETEESTESDDTSSQNDQEDLSSNNLPIRINEIFPYGDEFVEFYNPNQVPVNLSGWQLQDMQGAIDQFEFEQDLVLEPGQHYGLALSGKLQLNNDGDGLQLYNSKNVLVDEVFYQAQKNQDLSWQFFLDGWSWQPATKNLVNQQLDFSETEIQQEQVNLEASEADIDSSSEKDLQNQEQEVEVDLPSSVQVVNKVPEQSQDDVFVETCQTIDILVRVGKTKFYSPQGPVFIKNVAENLEVNPTLAELCGVIETESGLRADSVRWLQPSTNLVAQELADEIQPLNYSLVNLNLTCSGKTRVSVEREDLTIYSSYLTDQRPACVDGKLQGKAVAVYSENTGDLKLYYLADVVSQEGTESSGQDQTLPTDLLRSGAPQFSYQIWLIGFWLSILIIFWVLSLQEVNLLGLLVIATANNFDRSYPNWNTRCQIVNQTKVLDKLLSRQS